MQTKPFASILSLVPFCVVAASLGAGCTTPQGAGEDPTVDAPDVATTEQELGVNRPPVDPALKYADLGSCQVESGETIKDCKLAYRTFGTLNADKSNAVLWPTWFTGRTSDLVALGVPTKFVDTSRWYLILVDSLADGVSSSPSNSWRQPRQKFPRVNIRDMVDTEHRLLTEKLGIQHLRAVAGISMGGMQAIQWSVSYPDFMDKIVSVVGTPQNTSQDMLLWQSMINSLDENIKFARGYYFGHPQIKTPANLLQLVLFTPEYRAQNTSRADFPAFLAASETSTFDWNDEYRQLEALYSMDVSEPFGGSLEVAAARVRAASLYLNSAQDLVVNPIPAETFAPMVNATIEINDSNCGHLEVQVCNTDASAARIRGYLDAD